MTYNLSTGEQTFARKLETARLRLPSSRSSRRHRWWPCLRVESAIEGERPLSARGSSWQLTQSPLASSLPVASAMRRRLQQPRRTRCLSLQSQVVSPRAAHTILKRIELQKARRRLKPNSNFEDSYQSKKSDFQLSRTSCSGANETLRKLLTIFCVSSTWKLQRAPGRCVADQLIECPLLSAFDREHCCKCTRESSVVERASAAPGRLRTPPSTCMHCWLRRNSY